MTYPDHSYLFDVSYYQKETTLHVNLDKGTFLQLFVYTHYCFMHAVCFVIVIFGHTGCFDVKLIMQYHIVLETIKAKLEDLTPMFIIIEVIKRVRI